MRSTSTGHNQTAARAAARENARIRGLLTDKTAEAERLTAALAVRDVTIADQATTIADLTEALAQIRATQPPAAALDTTEPATVELSIPASALPAPRDGGQPPIYRATCDALLIT